VRCLALVFWILPKFPGAETPQLKVSLGDGGRGEIKDAAPHECGSGQKKGVKGCEEVKC
jgi:hypothetical protein